MVKQEIPDALKNGSKAVYEGNTYTLIAFRLYADKQTKKLRYSAELLDKNENSTCIVPIELIEIIKE